MKLHIESFKFKTIVIIFYALFFPSLSFGETSVFRFFSEEKAQQRYQKLSQLEENLWEVKSVDKKIHAYNVFVGPYKSKKRVLSLSRKLSRFYKVKLIQKKGQYYIYIGRHWKLRKIKKRLKKFPLKIYKARIKKHIRFYVVQKKQQKEAVEEFVFGESPFEDVKEETSPLKYQGFIKGLYGQFNTAPLTGISSYMEWTGQGQLEYNQSADLMFSAGLKFLQTSELDGGVSQTEVRADELFLKKRFPSSTLALGFQKVHWGRVFEGSPVDHLSLTDFYRFTLPSIDEKSWSQAALRYEYYSGNKTFDFIVIPQYTPSLVGEKSSVWSPVNSGKGELLGVNGSALIAQAAQLGSFQNPTASELAVAARFTLTEDNYDLGFTLQSLSHPLPYFYLNPEVVLEYQGNGFNLPQAISDTAGATFLSHNPKTEIIGFDYGAEFSEVNYRFELAYYTKKPITDESGEAKTSESVDWVMSAESNFGLRGQFQLNGLISGVHLKTDENILDRKDNVLLGLQFKYLFTSEDWAFNSRFSYNIKESDFYLNPELQYTGIDSNTLMLGLHSFSGDEGTIMGFYKNNSLAYVSWKYFF